MITLQDLKAIAPNGRADLLQAIVVNSPVLFPQYGITTERRVCHLLAQLAHESAGFQTLEEYASGAAYEGRKDLGNTVKGDGVRFKGRGYIQLTGRANYTNYGKRIGVDLVTNPSLAAVPKNALKLALEYWAAKGLNNLADRDDLVGITRKINGGTNGLKDRQAYLTRAKKVIQVVVQPVLTDTAVRPILASVGAPSVEAFQKSQGLKEDGIVGPATNEALNQAIDQTTPSGEAIKPTVTDILKSPDVVAPVAVMAGSSLVGALTASVVLQYVAAFIILAVFFYFAYTKLKG